MTTFYCGECSSLFEVGDPSIIQAMVRGHLGTGDGFVCPSCCPGVEYAEVPIPLYCFEKEETGEN